MGFNMQKLMKQAQKMQQDVARAQEELKNMQVEGAAGGGVVRVVANGSSEILSINIDPEIVDPEDVDMLEDLVLAAVKDALANAQALSAERMAAATGNMGGMPGMGGLF